MTVLRSREIIHKSFSSSSSSSSPKPSKSRKIELSTPSFRQKASLRTETPSSASQSPVESRSVGPRSDSVAASTSPAPRRSVRLASRLRVAENGDQDGEKEIDLDVDEGNRKVECGKKGSGRVLGSRLKEGKLCDSVEEKEIANVDVENELSLNVVKENVEGSGSGSAKRSRKRKTRVLGSGLERRSVSDYTEEKEIVEDHEANLDAEVENDGSCNVDNKDEETELSSSGAKDNDEKVAPDSMVNSGEVDLISGSVGLGRSGGLICPVRGKGKRNLEVYLSSPTSDLAAEDGAGEGYPNIQAGPRSAKKKLEGNGVDYIRIESVGNPYIDNYSEREGGGEQREVQGSGKGVDAETTGAVTVQVTVDNDLSSDKRRYSRDEKGKGKLVEESGLSNCNDQVYLNLKPEVEESGLSIRMDQMDLNSKPEDENGNKEMADILLNFKEPILEHEQETKIEKEKQLAVLKARQKADGRRWERERQRRTAKDSAPRFAHFRSNQRVDNGLVPAPESKVVSSEANQAIEDWPGPFSTAVKIISDRKLNARKNNFTSCGNEPTVRIEWTPSKNQRKTSMVPSLLDLSFKAFAKHAQLITSLKDVPDLFRNKLSQLLCDSRQMDSHFMKLLVSGSPTEIRVKDCSWMMEEQITAILHGCDTSNLSVLQLDLCGRCMPDYVLCKTLAQSTNSMPALVAISLKGACRFTDVGLDSLVTSAPGLRSVNLGQCSLISAAGIDNLVRYLGSLVRELYLDDCQSIDAMLIIPALKKLDHLEVLSVAGIHTVCDDFICQVISVCGPNMKELVLANCGNLTDTAMEAIAKGCPGLRALDIFNVHKLTDLAIGHLANGCRSIRALKLCRNAFSDEAIAAFLETSGEFLTELSLNNIKKVGPHTAISISRRCSRNLQSLDFSWCRNMTDEAVGLIVDSCQSLRVLKLFGCSQITHVLLDGHSNPLVEIIGLEMTPILDHLNMFDLQETPLRYSAVPVCTEL